MKHRLEKKESTSMTREPLLSTATVVTIVTAGIVLFTSFGLPISPDQAQAITAFVTVTAPLVLALVARRKVTPVADPKDSDGERLVRADADPQTD